MTISARRRLKGDGPAIGRRRGRGLLSILAVLAGLGVTALPALAVPAGYGEARSSKSYRYSCRPPLKFAAGACVTRCPAGYRDTGRYCRFKSMSR